MIVAVLSGRVSRAEWRQRIRVCLRCPLYRSVSRTCGPGLGVFRGQGCGCYVPFKARAALPYTGSGGSGCWGRAAGVVTGWGKQGSSIQSEPPVAR